MSLSLQVRRQLQGMAEPGYAAFSASLIPGVQAMLGVRLPRLRALAARLVKEGQGERYLMEERQDEWFEETMLCAMVIPLLPGDGTLARVRDFLPRVNNWSVCDSLCAGLRKQAKSQEEMFLPFIRQCLTGREVYTRRFGCVMLRHFAHRPETAVPLLRRVWGDGAYYVQMAAAWALCDCVALAPERALPLIGEDPPPPVIRRMLLQKARDSRRVPPDVAARLQSLLAAGEETGGKEAKDFGKTV